MRPISALLADLAAVRAEMSKVQEESARKMSPLHVAEGTLRDEIHEAMRESHINRVGGGGLEALRTKRTTPIITDQDELMSALKERGLYENCVRLDLNVAKKVGIAHEMPGIERVSKEVFTIRTAKE